MRKVRKMIALLYLVLAPCLLILVGVRSCDGFRDWVIDKGVVKIAGYTEEDAMQELRWVDDPAERNQAKAAIRDVFNKCWASSDTKAKPALRQVFDKYGMLWEN